MSKSDLERAFTVPRDPVIIDRDYASACAAVGHKLFQVAQRKEEITLLEKDCADLNEKIRDLNKEYGAAMKEKERKSAESKEAEVLVPSLDAAQALDQVKASL